MAKYLSGTYTSTYTLTINPTTVTSTGVIHVNSTSAAGIIGTSGVAWTLTNLGTVESVGSASVGINLASGGLVTNGTSGSTAGYIDGTTTGIQISGATGTVVNYGRVSQTGAAGNNAINLGAGGTITNRGTISEAGSSNAINLGAGGGLTNGASGSTAGLITGLQGGINISGSAGTITNFGTVSQTSTAGNNAINLGAGGTITNRGTISAAGTNASAVQFGVVGGKLINGTLGGTIGLITAYHLGIGFFPGAAVNPGTVTVVNYGTIVSTQTGTAAATGFSGLAVNFGTNSTGTIDNFGRIAGSQTAGGGAILLAGGVVTNEARGIIDGKGGNAVTSSTAGIAVTLTNFGTVQNASTTNSTVYLGHGGIVTNGATSSTGAAIVGTGTNSTSVAIKSATGTVNNFGTISDAGTFNSAIYIGAGGNVTNAASGRIVAAWTGVDVRNVAGTVNNLGTITSTATFVNSATAKAVGVVLEQGGTVINGAIGTTAGLIQAYELGVYIGGAFGTPHSGAVGLVFNYGTIASTGTGANAGAAVELSSGGTITNRGTIESVAGSAVVIKGTVAGAINNYGTIQDTGTIATAVVVSAGGTLTNRGLITSSAGAVSFTNTAGTVDNFGSIVSTLPLSATAGAGVYLGNGGLITNEVGASINAVRAAISLARLGTTTSNATIVNYGTVTGSTGITIGKTAATGNNTIINFGTIAGTGTAGVAISLGAGNDRVVIEAGSTLQGVIANLHPGDQFDLPFMSFSNSGTATIVSNGTVSQQLKIVENGSTFTVALDPNQSFAGDIFQLGTDSGTGTMITETTGQPAPSDFNGDGKSDILWQNASTGGAWIWEMNGTTQIGSGAAGTGGGG